MLSRKSPIPPPPPPLPYPLPLLCPGVPLFWRKKNLKNFFRAMTEGHYASIKKPSCSTIFRRNWRPRLIRVLTAVFVKHSLEAISPSE